MKTPDLSKFRSKLKTPEEIDFHGQDIPEPAPPPTNEADSPSSDRTNVRPTVRTDTPSDMPHTYPATVPGERRKIRHAFDIFEDQLVNLRKIQGVATVVDGAPYKAAPTLGDMVRKALDDYLEQEIQRSSNLELVHEPRRDAAAEYPFP